MKFKAIFFDRDGTLTYGEDNSEWSIGDLRELIR